MSAISLNGSGISAQLLHAMDGLSRDLHAQQKARAEYEANLALQEGFAEADDLRKKADQESKGAMLSGAVVGFGGLAQVGAASYMTVPGAGASAEQISLAKMENDQLSVYTQVGGTIGQLGKIGQDSFVASGSQYEADARVHAAKAQAASRRADGAQGDAQEAMRSASKGRDLYQQILELEHGARMAVLRG